MSSSAGALQPTDLVHDEDGGRLLDGAGGVVGAWFTGPGADAQMRALAAAGSAAWVVLDATDGAVFVPAENLIAAGRAAGTQTAVVVDTPLQVAGLAGALQLGVDALVAPASCESGTPVADIWCEVLKAKEDRSHSAAEQTAPEAPGGDQDGASCLMPAAVVAVDSIGGLGDRVCLDLVQLLEEGEGLLVGSTAKALCFVQAETAQTGLVPPRPFRINAGPVHMYVALADGKTTKYLSEVNAGDEVLVVNPSADGSGAFKRRRVTVGRCKTEPRPLFCVRFESDQGCGQLFLQQAETVRLLAWQRQSDSWGPLSVTKLKSGDKVLVRWSDRGTHVGRRIDATVSER